MLYRSIHAITKTPAHFLVFFLNYYTHLFRCCSACVYVCACVSLPRRTRVASAWHPRCTHRSRESAVFALPWKKIPRESQSDFNSFSERDARKQKVKEEKEETMEKEMENEGCDGSATRSPPSRASSTCCWRATRPPRRPGHTYPAMNRGQLREGENAAP